MFTRIRWRIAASYVALIAAVLIALGTYLVIVLRTQHLGRLETQLRRQAYLAADEAYDLLAARDAAALHVLARRLGQTLGVRVTLIAADGTVLGDSDHDPATMGNHSARPEVVTALRSEAGQSRRHSATLNQDLLYIAVPVERDGTLLGVARVAVPVLEVESALDQVVAAVGVALAAAAVLAIAIAIIIARVTTRRINLLTQAAQRFASGELEQHIPAAGRDEVSLLARAFNDMAAALRTHIRAVEAERERLAAIMSHMADGLVIADGEGLVRLINPAAARLLRTTPARARGRSLVAVVRHHALAALVHTALSGTGTAGPCLVELETADGRHAVQAMASRLPEARGASPQVLLILQDVTELRRTENVRRDFVANVSHELRTPVSVLKALVETLQDGALEDPVAARDFLARMQVEVDGLAQLVEELLELSRIEARQLRLRLQPVDLVEAVTAAAERLRPHAERQGLRLVVCPAGQLPPVQADPERIQQVVVNLIHNAIKFTPPGGQITVTLESRDGHAVVAVADTGIGIAPADLPRLFERFYKADRSRGSGGSGLGLAIAKHLVQVHGGRIWAESPGEGCGATFTFTLPLAASANVQ
jgi:two-component system phosphate regulon sensor histidine kinase PhoR